MPTQLPVHGEFHGTSSTGGEIVLYVDDAAHTLLATERVQIASAQIVVSASGDTGIYLDANDDNTLDAGEAVLRGTVAANGGIAHSWPSHAMREGAAGAKPHCVCASGTVDAVIDGFIVAP